ncbi:MAG TPA: nucleotidyltransferase family protein [Blastocatellia bacterium]|nr:nucleotidyltransferase family protein [Blastocatellia bacterium]
MISAILLAAGESRRMQGDFKPLLKWGSRTVIAACIDNLRRSRIDEIIVVLGHRESEIRARLAGAGVQFAINSDYHKGMLSSIKVGFTMVSKRVDGVMIALVDQPMIGPEVINPLAISFGDYESKISIPTYQGKHGHPIVVSRDLEDEIMQLDDNSPDGLKALIDNHRHEIQEVPVDSPYILEDIDSPEDYERLSKQVKPLYESNKWHP